MVINMNAKITAIEYISDLVREMQIIAERHDLDTLAYILAIAALDAAEIKSDLSPSPHE